MRVYQGVGYDGVSIVDHGLTINVKDGKANVEYNGHHADFYESLKTGKLSGIVNEITLNREQLAWLEDSKIWVKNQLAD